MFLPVLDIVCATYLGFFKISFDSQAFSPCLVVEKASTYNWSGFCALLSCVAFQSKIKKGFLGSGLHETVYVYAPHM